MIAVQVEILIVYGQGKDREVIEVLLHQATNCLPVVETPHQIEAGLLLLGEHVTPGQGRKRLTDPAQRVEVVSRRARQLGVETVELVAREGQLPLGEHGVADDVADEIEVATMVTAERRRTNIYMRRNAVAAVVAANLVYALSNSLIAASQ